jgi:hypothetical protein
MFRRSHPLHRSNPHSRLFQETLLKRGPLPHYVFKSRPISAKAELPIGTPIGGFAMSHVTIEATRQEWASESVQRWFRDTIMTHVSPTSAVVIVIMPEREEILP